MTRNLWRETDYVVPSPDPKLVLAQTPKGILVQYDAIVERTGDVSRRAYLLEPNLRRIIQDQAPDFVNPGRINPQSAIPIFSPPPGTEARSGVYAVFSTNTQSFNVFRNGKVIGPCPLPTYKDSTETAAQVALTPLAVVGDATIVGAVLGYIWAENGAPH